MTPQDALAELLMRVGSNGGAAVFTGAQELAGWPPGAVAAMTAQKLLVKARPAVSVVCSGCERECVMPVHVLPVQGTASRAFVVCDKRSDINRVNVPIDRLEQWQATADAVAKFIADDLSLRVSGKRHDKGELLEIGIVTGKKRIQMLYLGPNGELVLVAGSNRIPLAEAILFSDGRYAINADLIRQLVDTSITGDTRYSPSPARHEVRKMETEAMREQWRKEYRALKKRRPNMSDVWYSQQIAKLEIAQGRDAETIRKQLKK